MTACRTASVFAGFRFPRKNLRRGHYDIATGVPSRRRFRVAFNDLAPVI
jgi:hypothetical protein